MSKTKPINIEINGNITVKPEGVYLSSVVPSGNGAVIKFFKQFIGKEVVVLVKDHIMNDETKAKKM